ncbi:MAG: O-antigen ligase family protein [Clostridia bacterium]|nr:O-antigen ligase family protein [Clostridia bacterium]
MLKDKKMLVIVTSIIFMISSILIESKNKYYVYLQILSYGIVAIYLLIQRKKIKIIENKLDIFVILLVISTAVPVLSNTYTSLHGTVLTILQYMYIFGIYIIGKSCTNSKKGLDKIITIVLIATGVLTILIGIEDITTHKIVGTLKKIGHTEYLNGEDRLISVFGYSNVLAVYIASLVFINISEALKAKNEIGKSIYKTITYIFITGIILTYSKGIFIVFPILMIAYTIKEKDNRSEIIQNLLISSAMALIYITIFENISDNIMKFMLFPASMILCFEINLAIEKYGIKLEKKHIKALVIILIISILIILMYIAINLKIYGEYKIYSGPEKTGHGAKIINNVKGEQKYNIEFELEAKSPFKGENIFDIKVVQRDKKNKKLEEEEISFGNYKGIKVIEIITNANTSELKIEFIVRNIDSTLIIKKLIFNGQEIPLKYKYLPTKLVNKVKNININYKTAQERITVIKDALKLSKENFIFGIGGNGWQHNYKNIQEYDYTVNKIHSYPAKVILEYGVLGIITYLGIAVIVISTTIKSKNAELTPILFAILVIGFHSLIDADMEFMHILVYTFMLLAIVSKNIDEHYKKNKFINIIFAIIMIFSIYLSIDKSLYDTNSKISELISQRNGLQSTSDKYKSINTKIAKQYEKISKYERHNEIYFYDKIIEYYSKSNYENKDEKLKEYYNKMSEYIYVHKLEKNYNEMLELIHNEIQKITSEEENIH